MAMEFAARLPNEPTETVIIEDHLGRYHKEETAIRLAIKRLSPQAQAAVARFRAEYRKYKQSTTGENTSTLVRVMSDRVETEVHEAALVEKPIVTAILD